MGYEHRDYSQDEAWKGESAPDDIPVTKWFVIVTVAVFILQAFLMTGAALPITFRFLSLDAEQVFSGQVWRLLTFAICNHPLDIISLVFSLLVIWNFGTALERMYGSWELAHYLVGSILVVAGAFCAWGLFLKLNVPLFGSFISSLALLTLFATHYPRMEVYIFPMISIQLRWLVALYALFGLYPALIQVQGGGGVSGLAYASGLWVIPFALAYRRYDWRLSGLTPKLNPAGWMKAWRRRSIQRNLRVFKPEVDDLDTKVDQILVKIHEQGSESLTDAERALLIRASDRAKQRS